MHIVYIDDSKDLQLACFSALIIPAGRWPDALDVLIDLRRDMKRTDGVFVRKEIHATEWNAGKGQIAPRRISKQRRARLFDRYLDGITRIPGLQIINAAGPCAQEERLFERLLMRIQVNMEKSNSRAVVFSDEGKNYDSLLRKMRRVNYVPSKFGAWENGKSKKNIVANRINEDIVYRDSARSFFIQAADCCAYALLRYRNPVPSKTALGLDRSFLILESVLVKQANARDPFGIVTA